MHHVDVVMSPISAENLARYRRKLEAMALDRLQRVRRAIIGAAVLAGATGLAAASIQPGSSLATFLAVLVLGLTGFMIPTAVAAWSATRRVGGAGRTGPLLALTAAWLAGAGAWVHGLAPSPDAALILAVVALATMQTGWTIGGSAGRRLIGPHLELARLRPVEPPSLHVLARFTEGVPGSYLAAVAEQGRMPVVMEYEALQEYADRAAALRAGRSSTQGWPGRVAA